MPRIRKENKTLAIGTIVEYNGVKYEVVESDTCADCSIANICPSNTYNDGSNKMFISYRLSIFGNCNSVSRSDGKSVVFARYHEKAESKATDEAHTMPSTGGIDDNNGDNVQECLVTYDNKGDINKLKVCLPKGYKIDSCNVATGILTFKKEYITLDDVYNKLISEHKDLYSDCINVNKNIEEYTKRFDYMLALANLLDIAQYYNGNWKPDWSNDSQYKYYINYDNDNDNYTISSNTIWNQGTVYFKNKEDVQAVIDNPNFRDILNKVFKV